MSSSEAKFSPFKSKKSRICNSASKSESPDPVSLSSKTPEKSSHLSHRTRNRGVALSIREVRKVAESLQDQRAQRQRSNDRAQNVKSARRKIAPSFAEVSPRKSKASMDEPVKMPEKYEILGEFFDSLDSSIRLLSLKGSSTTFTNVCPKIECLTDRRFTHSHLAQLKYIFPEALVVKKVLRFDERTSCMKPDLHLSLDPDSKSLSEGGSVSLRKIFRARLRDFYESHPEVDEIPEEMLPEPFNRRDQDRPLEMSRTTSSLSATAPSNVAVAPHHQVTEPAGVQDNAMAINSEPATGEENLSVPVNMSNEAHQQQPAGATHMSQSFRRRFSQKSVKDEADGVQKKSSVGSLPTQSVPVSESSVTKNSSSVDTTTCPTICASPANLKSSGASVATPNKAVSTPSRLMTHTPSLPPPKRCYMSPDDSSCSSPNKLVRRASLKKSLTFDTPVKNQGIEDEADDADGISPDDEIFDILPKSLLQSIKEKERVAMEERNPAISRAKRRQKMIASLPKLFNMIHLLVHSMNRSVVTKEELLSKIISNHCDIVDRREVEEQLNLLLELVPEWISEKLASSGDLLFCINKMQSPETIRSQLAEAK